MDKLLNLGASGIKELSLWAGVAVSVILGLLWCAPYVIVYGLGSGHTTDAVESALIVCLVLAGISFLAAILFMVGAIKNVVSADGSSVSIPTVDDSGGDVESV